MTHKEMKKWMERFIYDFAPSIAAEGAKVVSDKFKAFYEENDVPADIDRMFTESGYGRTFYRMTGQGIKHYGEAPS